MAHQPGDEASLWSPRYRRNIPRNIELAGRPNAPRIICAGVDVSGGAGNYNALVITQYIEKPDGHFFEVLDCKGVNCRQSGVTLDDVVKLFADMLKARGLSVVYGDRFGGQWPAMRFADHGIKYANPIISGRVIDPGSANNTRTGCTTSVQEMYYDLTMCVQELGPWIRSRRVSLPDHPQLLKELKNMEARAKSGSKLSISAPPGADHYDDHVAALAISVTMCAFQAGIIRLPGGVPNVKPWASGFQGGPFGNMGR